MFGPWLGHTAQVQIAKIWKVRWNKCPENHLATYCNKMASHARNEDLLIHVFYDSLAGAAAQWYRGLKKNQIHTWRDLVRAFLGRYKYMLETIPDRLTLQNMKKRPDEDYREYAVRWKNMTSMVRPSLTNREENFMFVDTLPSLYYDMLIVNTFVEFRRVLFRSSKSSLWACPTILLQYVAKWFLGHLVPSYFSNFGILNLGGMTRSGT